MLAQGTESNFASTNTIAAKSQCILYMYIYHASVKTQVLIHPVHCITGRAQFMLHSHGLFT